MYRLMLYFLSALWVIALIFSFLGLIPVNPVSIVFSTLLILVICWSTNKILAFAFKAPTNIESVYITAFILSLILEPASSTNDYIFQTLVSFLAISSKFILAIGHKHIFNPVAFGIAIGALILNQQASWWVGILPMWPFILIGGLVIARKIQRFDLIWSFFIVTIFTFFLKSVIPAWAPTESREGIYTNNWIPAFAGMTKVFFDTQLLFFAFIMLTEPQTTPPSKNLRILYGGLIGLLFYPYIRFGNFSLSPELALLIGNIFSYFVSPKFKLSLKLAGKEEIAPNTFDFSFTPNKQFNFLPGQYLEWTLGIKNPDSRGNRRYFTLASSPAEDKVHLGIKFYENGSSFKKALTEMKTGDIIIGSQLSGEFTLPKNSQTPLVFIAGGIGITPFRSMVKHLLEEGEKRPLTLIYAAKTEADFAYKDLFDKAQKTLGVKVVYQTDKQGKVDEQLIKKVVPDLKKSIFYLSGPHSMVSLFEQILKDIGTPSNHIKIDFFPGYA